MRRWVIVTAVVAVAIIGVVGVIIVTGSSDSKVETVTLEPVNTTSTDPFTPSVAGRESADLPASVRLAAVDLTTDRITGALTAKGTTPGLYGGTKDERVCDPQQLVTYLVANPAKAKAWAGVLGIRPQDIKAYVATLTPVVLTTDTRVTNHGYTDGKATTLQSVLQAGTAVLVDARGLPRVKCGCGNPLTEPSALAAPAGDPWPGYAPARTATITPAPKPATTLTLTDTDTGGRFEQPVVGGSGRGPIHGVDFLNRTVTGGDGGSYPCLPDGSYALVDGKWEQEDSSGFFTDAVATKVVYLDATGDGNDEAIVSLTYLVDDEVNCGSSVVYAMKDGDVVELGHFPAPNAGVDPVLNAAGDIVIWHPHPTASDPACCPSAYAKDIYTHFGGKIIFKTEQDFTPAEFKAQTAKQAKASSRGPIHEVDFQNFSYVTHQPEETSDGADCSFGEVTLAGGKAVDLEFDDESYEVKVTYADATGDGTDDAVVALTHYSGSSFHNTSNLIFGMRDGKAVELGCVPGDAVSPIDGSGSVTGWTAISNGSISRSDATSAQKVTYAYRDGRFVLVANETVPISELPAPTRP